MAVELLPGMPNVISGIMAPPTLELFAASGAATPASSPVPNLAPVGASRRSRQLHLRHDRIDLHARAHALEAVDDDELVGCEPRAHDTQAADVRPNGYGPVLDRVVFRHDEDVALVEVRANRGVTHEGAVVGRGSRQAQPHEQTRSEVVLRVGKNPAGVNRAGGGIDLVVEKVHLAVMREILFATKGHFDRLA